jgi:3-hydroxybutyryl-CoA dehydrogenase
MASIDKVGVVGCGIMGSGIAEVCARSGVDVVVVETTDDLLAAGQARIRSSLEKAVQAGKLDEASRTEALGRLHLTTELSELSACALVIEAISEQEHEKLSLFKVLDEIVDPASMLASNTSSIPIARLAAATSRPQRVLGVHFFNPVPVMPLVEIVASLQSEPEVIRRCEEFVTSVLNKRAVRAPDRAGFIVNALLVPYLLSAVSMLDAHLASAEAIDAAMELGCAHPMGPLKLCDLIGIDTVKAIADSLYEEHADPHLKAPPLLSRMVDAGMLGRKTGRGFYTYR